MLTAQHPACNQYAWVKNMHQAIICVQSQSNATEASGQDSSATEGTQASTAKSGDVSTERKSGSLTNQQVPKNLSDADGAAAAEGLASSAASTAAGITNVAGKTAANAAAGAATGGAAGGAIVAIGGFDEAIPHARQADVQQLEAVASTLQNASNTVSNASGLASVRQELERKLQDGLDGLNSSVHGGFAKLNTTVQGRLEVLNETLKDKSMQVGKSIRGSANAQGKSVDSPGMSQWFLVFGALLVFGLFMLRRRQRKRHAGHAASMSLLGPGVTEQGIGGWLRPRSSRHRLAND